MRQSSLPLLCSILLTASLRAGDPDLQLRAQLASMRDSDKTTVFIYLAEQVDVKVLVARLDAMNATREFRNRLVVSSLKDLAARTQPPLRAVLDSFLRAGKAESLTRFWIFNGFAIRATKAAITSIANRKDVGPMLWAGSDRPGSKDLIEPVSSTAVHVLGQGPESGLLECKADYIWAKGFTGKSVIVANVDTGVELHSALAARWRGNSPGVSAKAAWLDPIRNTSKPSDLRGHGTHTMGTICGNDGKGNLIGMAPDALWIAANPIDGGGTRAQRNVWYNAAIQWTADPDGNPTTANDVPVVCSNSWGVRDPRNGVPPCSPVFNAAIDAAEASTVAYVWAAGNEGSRGPRVPADRIATDTNSFCVGALDPGSTSIASFSSRGPSPCDNKTIKPEVSARGRSVRSSYRGGGYRTLSGTSMATPHVAGAIALLRDVWSEITVPRVKKLLMETANDLGSTGEDNTYGFGRINLQQAYDKLLRERPDVSISVMGTQQKIKEGSVAFAHVVLSSYSQKNLIVDISIELYFQGKPLGYFFIPRVPIWLPVAFSNRAASVVLPFFIPKGLPASLLNQPIGIRGTVYQGNKIISSGEYSFVATR